MRIYNSDGSEPQMCGNGIRCMAKFLSSELEQLPSNTEKKYTIWTGSAFPIIYSFFGLLCDEFKHTFSSHHLRTN
jgi:hypothetical protein